MSTKPQDANATTCDGNNKPSAKTEETTAENQRTVLDLDDGEIRSGFVCGLPV